MQNVCGLQCALERSRAKGLESRKREGQRLQRSRKEAAKTITDYHKTAQQQYNRWVKYRDWEKPCISCGQPHDIGARHCSHYRSRAAASSLRYHWANTNMSCAQCNSYKSGNVVPYRVSLVRKYGEDIVQRLENNNGTRKWTKEELQRIAKVYRRKAKHYAKLRRVVM